MRSLLLVTILPLAAGWSTSSGALRLRRPPAPARVPLVVASEDLHMALRAAIEREDYAEAARLKKEIDASTEQQTADTRQAKDLEAAELVDSSSIDQMLQSAGADGIVVLHFTSSEQTLANSLVARTASRYASSQLVGGPVCGFVQLSEAGFERLGKASTWVDPRKAAMEAALPAPPPPPAADGLLPGWKAVVDEKTGRTYYYDTQTKQTSWTRPLTEAARAASQLCVERGVRSLPTTQVWQGGAMVREVASTELEALLLELGARSVEGNADVTAGNERYRDRNQGTGLPSADAVDSIDFTGGVAGAGGTELDRFKGRDRGTTRSYLPDLVDKPGDDMDPKGNKPPDGNGPGTLRKGPDWSPKKPTA